MQNQTKDDGDRISRHILPTAGTMVGVCVTLIGLVKISETRAGPSDVDKYAAYAALVFLVSALASYLSLRGGWLAARGVPLERIADGFFVLGLVVLTGVAVLYAFEIV